MELNQYYTEDIFGDRLIQSLDLAEPKLALDIGFGKGSLLQAAKRRWRDLDLVGIDVDFRNIELANITKQIQALEFNGFDPKLPEIIKSRFGEVDLLVSNPPFFSKKLDSNIKLILDSVGLLDCLPIGLKQIPAELVFLAQNLRLLTKRGALGIIVPAGLISGEKLTVIREFLFTNYEVQTVIQLPTNSFKNTDAQTFILIIRHKTVDSNSLSLAHYDKDAIINISLKNAVFRCDFDFYNETNPRSLSDKLHQDDFKLFRGKTTHKDLIATNLEFIHTTKMPKVFTEATFDKSPICNTINAQAGDVLIARVGRRCLGRIMHVQKGCIPISDCIISIRPKNSKTRKIIISKLNSPGFQNYIIRSSLGVGARYITYNILNDFLVS